MYGPFTPDFAEIVRTFNKQIGICFSPLAISLIGVGSVSNSTDLSFLLTVIVVSFIYVTSSYIQGAGGCAFV